MKKRFLAILLALCLAVGLLPMGAVAEVQTPTQQGLYASSLSWDKSAGTAWLSGYQDEISTFWAEDVYQFIYVNESGAATALTADKLQIEGFEDYTTTLRTATASDYDNTTPEAGLDASTLLLINFGGVGTGKVKYVNGEAVIAEMNVTVSEWGGGGNSQPHMNFYDVSFDGETYTVDTQNGPWGGFGGGEGDTRYILPFIGDTENPQYITDGLQSDDENVVTVEKIIDGSNVYWKVAFKSSDTTTLSYTDGEGTTYIIDINPGGGNQGYQGPQLYWAFVNEDDGVYTPDNEIHDGEAGTDVGNVWTVAFYIEENDNMTLVTGNIESSSNNITVTRVENTNYWRVAFVDSGDATLTYTSDTQDEWGTYPTYGVIFHSNGGGGNNDPEPQEYDTGLYWSNPYWNDNGEMEFRPDWPLESSLTLEMGGRRPVYFVFYNKALADDTTSPYTVLTSGLTFPTDVMEVQSGENDTYEVGGTAVTASAQNITYTTDGITYYLPVTVTLPEHGFYKAAERTPANLLSDNVGYQSLEGETKYVYLLTDGGYKEAELAKTTISKSVWREGEETTTTITSGIEQIDFGVGKGLKVALPDPGDEGYSLQASREEDWGTYYMANLWVSPGSGGGNNEHTKNYDFYSELDLSKSIQGNLAYGDLAADARFIYLLAEGGSTEEELNAITVEITDNEWHKTADAETNQVAFGEGKALKITLPDAGRDGYGVKATIGNNNVRYLWVSPGTGWDILSTGGVELTVEDKSYGVAFGNVMNGDGIIHLDVWTSTYPDETFAEPNADNERTRGSNPFTVMAGISIGDGQYTDITNTDAAPFNITVDKMWFELYDDQLDSAECFSWAQDSAKTTLSSNEIGSTTHTVDDKDFTKSNSAWLYHKEGYAARAIVKAEVTITPKASETVVLNGETITNSTKVTVSVKAQVTRTVQSNWTREQDDTVEALNAFLAQQAASIDITQNNHFNLTLANNTTYVGQIVIPAVFAMRGGSGAEQDLRINGGENTVIQGGINLNGILVGGVSGLTFRAGAENDTEIVTDSRAIYGGSLNDLRNCSFENYAVAVDSSAGQIFPKQNNTFIHNGIAVKVDLPASNDNMVGSWYNNIFRNNEIAVQVIKLLDPTSPYLFRLCDSDFICNGTDFDIQYPGEYYFYRNYYYCEQQSAVRAPQIQQHNGVTLHCYPARSSSVFDGQGNAIDAAEATLILGDDNTILDNEAGNLLIGEDALTGHSVNVVEDDGSGAELLATWTFGADEQGGND